MEANIRETAVAYVGTIIEDIRGMSEEEIRELVREDIRLMDEEQAKITLDIFEEIIVEALAEQSDRD